MKPSQTILVVDDEPQYRANLGDTLEDMGFEVLLARDGGEGLELFHRSRPDLVLADLNMPGVDGFSLLETITLESPETPVIIVSGVGVIEEVIRATRMGAWDFLTKPISDVELLTKTLDKALKRRVLLRERRLYTQGLEKAVDQRNRELQNEVEVRRQAERELQRLNTNLRSLNQEIIFTQKEILYTLAGVVESRSSETAYHVQRVGRVSHYLAGQLGLGHEECQLLQLASPMHDVGKIGIPDAILNKPDRLTAEEFEVIKTHTTIGYDVLKHSTRPIMKAAAVVALQHHENFDGTGYPQKLAGEDIHIYGRITALADVFDALAHPRIYREAWDIGKVMDYIASESGKKFDPELVRIMQADLPIILTIQL
ncbi:hypothetical protein JCM15519_37820 [Fundidesulfovibrio butyratiphilus]